MKTAVISNEIVIASYPKRDCQHVTVERVESETVTVVWRRCD